MEKETLDTSTLKKSLYNDPNARFRVKVENSKRLLEKARSERMIKQGSNRKLDAFLKSIAV